MRYLFFVLAFILSPNFLKPSTTPYFVVDGAYDGLFKTWHVALELLDEYEHGSCSGFKIAFSENSKYCDKARGPNWWEYYFHPLQVGAQKGRDVISLPKYRTTILKLRNQFEMKPSRANFLFKKYIKIKPQITNQVVNFSKCSIGNSFAIGVSYQKPEFPELETLVP